MLVLGREDLRELLSYQACIAVVREAMVALSTGQTRQLLRQVIPLQGGEGAFGTMPGAMGEGQTFGAKLISVFPGNFEKGLQSHQGVVVLFDPETGAPVCVLHAGEITAIRTGAASAVATDALARPDARRLAILGYGEQAESHVLAIRCVRPIDEIRVWGRSLDRATAFAERMGEQAGIEVRPAKTAEEAVADADVICTVTAAAEPILRGAWVRPGAHVNVVGSSRPGPVEIDEDLFVRASVFADHREGVLNQGAEFLRAKAAGRVAEDHVRGEIGEVLAGLKPGRSSEDEVTLYKSLGSIVQDLASGWYVYTRARELGVGSAVPF